MYCCSYSQLTSSATEPHGVRNAGAHRQLAGTGKYECSMYFISPAPVGHVQQLELSICS